MDTRERNTIPVSHTAVRVSRRAALGRAGGAGIAFAAVGLRAGQAAAAEGTATPLAGHPLVGSWRTTVTLEGREPFSGLSVYTSDGITMGAGPIGAPAPPNSGSKVIIVGTGVGTWISRDERRAAETFSFFVTDDTGKLIGLNTVRSEIEVDAGGDAWIGSAVLTLGDPTGQPGPSRPARVEGRRITVEPAAGTPEAGP